MYLFIVGKGHSYQDINAAIADARKGDVILVKAGHYDAPIIIDKQVCIIGENSPYIVRGVDDGRTIEIVNGAENVILYGLVFCANPQSIPGKD